MNNPGIHKHTVGDLTPFKTFDRMKYSDMQTGDVKSFSSGYNLYKDLFYILLFFNLVYFAVFIYLYAKDLVKIY